ncbi:MAG: thioredoxin family protein [Muribaculaceae bacterium]
MKKSLSVIVTLVMLFIFSSSYTNKVSDGKIGFTAPNFALSNTDTTMSLQRMKGKYVLLSFWSSADAGSRISNIEYNNFAKNNSKNLHLVAVNYDRSEAIYREIMSRDKLDAKAQFYDHEGSRSQLFENYHLDQGLKSYLINPEGEIIAQNPSAQQLTQLICQ